MAYDVAPKQSILGTIFVKMFDRKKGLSRKILKRSNITNTVLHVWGFLNVPHQISTALSAYRKSCEDSDNKNT